MIETRQLGWFCPYGRGTPGPPTRVRPHRRELNQIGTEMYQPGRSALSTNDAEPIHDVELASGCRP